MFTKIPFKVDYPLKIFHPTNLIDFENKKERAKLFQRNIYYHLFEKKTNQILESKHKFFLDLNKGILEHLKLNHPSLEILSTSLFGSALVFENPGDYDFLAITKGDVFLLEESILKLNEENIKVGISIKGVNNYFNGFKKKDDSLQSNQLEQIIDRTVISLFRRHIPLCGKDFLNNEKLFLNNAYAQVSDLINNTYELFYVEDNDRIITKQKRAKKILNRCYEAISYMGMVDCDSRIIDLKKEIYSARINNFKIEKSKEIFDKLAELYEEKIRFPSQNSP